MTKFSKFALLAVTTMLTPPVLAAPAQSVPMTSLVGQVSIPHTMFKLKNGLTVIVHEDHKAPIAAVSVWYNVGSKDEPKGKTGFAHLFEHLMFNGTENLRATSTPIFPRSARPTATGRPGSTAPIISRPCRPARSSGRCSWKATAWDICSAR